MNTWGARGERAVVVLVMMLRDNTAEQKSVAPYTGDICGKVAIAEEMSGDEDMMACLSRSVNKVRVCGHS